MKALRLRIRDADSARRYLARVVWERCATRDTVERHNAQDWLVGGLRYVEDSGLEHVACGHGWTAGCDGRREVTRHARGCFGGACPCPDVPCEECCR